MCCSRQLANQSNFTMIHGYHTVTLIDIRMKGDLLRL